MRILSSLQCGVLQKPFSYNGRHFLCVSLLWAFRLETGDAVLETEMWQALGDLFKEGRVFDQSMPKDRGEFLCAGSFHAPGGRAVRQEALSVRVGDRRKKLLVTGPREWRAGVATRPAPITSLPIRYDQAFGGEGFPDNPTGKGYGTADSGGETGRPLPRVEYPRQAVTSPSQTPQPASLEGRDLSWRPRKRYAGTYDEEYMRKRMPGLPDDVDWRLFNDAAEDQWIDGFFRGDEDFELIHMHPDKERLAGRLPGVWGRAFVERRIDPSDKNSEIEFREVPLRLDTVWLLPDAELGVVIHRGTTEIAEDDATDVVNILAAHENIGDQARPRSHYQEEMTKRGDPEEGYRYMLDTRALLPSGVSCAIQDMVTGNDIQIEHLGQQNSQAFSQRQKEEAQTQIDEQSRQLREQVDANPDYIPEAAQNIGQEQADAKKAIAGEHKPSEEEQDLLRIMEKLAPGASSGGQIDITRVDFTAFDELAEYSGRQFAEQQAKGEDTLRERIAELKRQNVPEREDLKRAIADAERALASMHEPAPLPRPKLAVEFDQVQQQIDEIDRYREQLRAGGVDEARIKESVPDIEQIRQQVADAESKIAAQYREGAHYLGESRSPHPGEEGARRAHLLAAASGKASASGGDYAFIDLSGVTIRDLDLSGAYLEYVDFSGATLIGVNLAGAVLAKAQLRNCVFANADFTNANIGATLVENAEFDDCDFTQARLARAVIRDSRFRRCRLLDRPELFLEAEFSRASFIDCEMHQANFIERDLSQCSFRGSDLTQSNFLKGDLTRADFTGANLARVNIVSNRSPGACFESSKMPNVRFIDEPEMNDCNFRSADLQGANLRSADLTGADFTRANLEGADLSESNLSEAIFDRAHAVGAQFRKADLSGATLRTADLREASMMKARLVRTRFTGANLYSVSFLFSTLGETDFHGANMDNTILRDWKPHGG